MSGLPYRAKDGDQAKADPGNDEEEDIDEGGYKTVRDAVLFAIEVNPSMLMRPPASDSKKADNSSPLEAALKCAFELMQQRIISSPKDLMGILLYGTQLTKFYDESESTRGGWSFPNCYLLTDLDIPEADDVKAIKRLLEGVDETEGDESDSDGTDLEMTDDDETDDEDDLDAVPKKKSHRHSKPSKAPTAAQLFKPSKESVEMHSVLFCANQIFQQKAPNFLSRRLFVVTDNDESHGKDKDLRSQATVRAKDLYDLGVIIELFPISSSKHTFNTKLFWDDIVYKSSPTDPDAILYNPASWTDTDKALLRTGTKDGISLLQALLTNIASRATPKRALFSGAHLELGPDFSISVKGFLLYKHQKPVRSTYIYLGSEKPQIVKGQAARFAADDKEEEDEGESKEISTALSHALTSNQNGTQSDTQQTTQQLAGKTVYKKAYTFGGEQITFTPDEMASIRDFGTPVIRIIGFKPIDMLPMWANTKTSTFIYPSEEDFVGSTRVYSALYQKMAKGQLFALAWFIPRKNAGPTVAAIVPTLEYDPQEGGTNKAGTSPTGAPQGLYLIPLPFADDLRQNPPSLKDTPLRAPDELVDKMRPIIEQLNLPKGVYDPNRYPNPALQWHYRILQAMALDEELPQKPEDKTIPKYRQIDKRIGEMAIEWGNQLENTFKDHVATNPDAAMLGGKRPSARSEPQAESKRIKPEAASSSEEDIRALYEKNDLKILTLPVLKEFAKSKSISVTSKDKKDAIVEKIEAYFESK